ncbi:LuxR C-terminal-related transcriptional regulator [Variovorax guangxiensis]|uniref:LuxR C-terminal-related transcriptional regulator n=1 Tax=Variovorax guangxiensis TaxID=1775474 RepID=UPI002863B844|nr:LuxR C-terminal-related transcriptional regulator [Variovorax guangxiensis]MDR6857201.1 LuxR family maltose regulon positive regulatory protein [Variovorax guangxiensis]
MTYALTKIRIPSFRSGLIERADLERRLGEALLTRRLILLVAPAGFGKTAALSRQLSLLPPECISAWVAADEQDDLPRFLTCLFDALEPYDPPWRVAPESLAEQACVPGALGQAVGELADALAAMTVDHGVIVFDDMHTIPDPRIFEFLRKLLELAPLNWTLAISSRTPPPLPLARLRARRELAEFGQADLRFTPQETRLLLRESGQADSDGMVERVLGRTDGWIAGLCLVLDAAGRSVESAAELRLSQRHLSEYLASEVFGRLSQPWQLFLMRCSVLPELSADRCAKVSGNPRAAEMLEEIERRGLFVSVLDADELMLRLHDLFRAFLEEQLLRQRPDEVPQLLRLAAEDEADTARKLGYLLRASAWREAEDMLVAVTPSMLAQGDGVKVASLLRQFPEGPRAESPRLAYVRGLLAFGELSPELLAVMREAAVKFEREGDLCMARRALALSAYGGALQSFHVNVAEILAALEGAPPDLETDAARLAARYWGALVSGPSAVAEDCLRRLVSLLEDSGTPALWFRFLPYIYGNYVTPAFPDLARRIVAGALAAAGDGHVPLQLLARSNEGWLLLWQGHVAESRALALQLEADEKWAGRPRHARVGSWILMVAQAMVQGDREAVRVVLSDKSYFKNLPRLEPITRGLAASVVEDWAAVRQALEDLSGMEMHGSYWAPFPRLLEAKLALHEHRVDEGLGLLRECVKTSQDIDRFGFDAMARGALALAELRAGRPQAAWAAMEPLVERSRSTGLMCGVLMCGPRDVAELARSRWGAEVSEEARAEMRRWVALSLHAQESGKPGMPEPALPDSKVLTAREMEVMERIAAGDSNKLIARALDLSPHTVKRHVARILDRLDLSSRGEAAAWFHERAER